MASRSLLRGLVLLGSVLALSVTTLPAGASHNPTSCGTIRYGDGHDTVIGSSDCDDIFAGGGYDDVWGRGGRDDIHGNEGDDFVQGESHGDHVHGDKGDDYLKGGDGDDRVMDIVGDGDIDRACGNNDNDFIDVRDGDGLDSLTVGGADNYDKDPGDYLDSPPCSI